MGGEDGVLEGKFCAAIVSRVYRVRMYGVLVRRTQVVTVSKWWV